MADLAAADAELARRFTVPKQFLIANRATYSFYTAFLGRVGRPGELAPIVEAPGGGYLLGLHRDVAELEQHPEVVRLDAAGAVMWRLALPRPLQFQTFEVMGVLLAPDGTLLVMTIPYSGRGGNPHPAMLAKVSLDGQLVWSMLLAEDRRRVDGPFPQDLSIDADGTIHLTGHATYQRERRPGHDATLRAWTGRVSAAGRQLTDTISGEYTWTIDDSPSARRVFAFWHDLHRPRW
jgi:hypothetical protein